jgi:rSAM/selenodomain-associated transferase 1
MLEAAVGLMARFPQLGEVKTRLVPDVGEKRALIVYQELLDHAVAVTLNLDGERFYRTAFVTPAESIFQFKSIYPRLDRLYCQTGDDLGARMLNAFATLLEREHLPCAILIGADIPAIDSNLIAEAHNALADNDLVLGPTHDGGYYLIGMNRPLKQLFTDIQWSTDQVLTQTLVIADRDRLKPQMLPVLRDLDDMTDLQHFKSYRALIE